MRFTAFILAMALPAAAQSLPSADQILAKYVEALGGKEAIEKQQSRVAKGTVEVTTFGVTGAMEHYAKAPDKDVTITTVEGYGTVIHCFDGRTAWISDPENGQRDMPPEQAARARRGADLRRALKLKEQFSKLAVTGIAKVGQSEAYVLEGTPAEGPAEKMYFDASNGLLLKTEFTGEGGLTTSTLEDYRSVEGVKIPFLIRQDSPQLNLVIKFSEVTANVPVDDAKFAKPAN